MRDFSALPAEITSARLSRGPGSGPLLAAASAWDALAHTLESTATGFTSVITRLQCESWSGIAADAMAGTAAGYVAWVSQTGSNAVEAARRARAAAAACEMALAAIVPPEAVAANRSQLLKLVATNVFGQNALAIAATEAAYEQMWAQDAAAMFNYAASSSTASTLYPFADPPPGSSASAQLAARGVENSPVGTTRQTLAQLVAKIPHGLQRLATVDTANAAGRWPTGRSWKVCSSTPSPTSTP
ncbi:PPE family protein [Mycobacterium genavense]|uniref:PPE family protein n=1 Tax=Mycobacterium genavense TaxID=36812 RepID=UPI0004AD1497|nr:PPE family protein [Mycobacterium genavense]